MTIQDDPLDTLAEEDQLRLPCNDADRLPAEIEKQVLAISNSSSVDALCAAIDAADWLLSRAKGIHQLSRQIAIAWIEHNGAFDMGSTHYCVGYSNVTKCLDVPRTGHAVLDAAGGDFDQFLSVLAAQPYKHATVRSFIGEAAHDRLFAIHQASRLVAGKPPERVLKRVDQRFLPQRATQRK